MFYSWCNCPPLSMLMSTMELAIFKSCASSVECRAVVSILGDMVTV